MKNRILFFLISLIFFSCEKEDFTVENLNGNKITSLGHAGMGIGKTYPMNSFESIAKCLNLGMDGSEFDVQMTKDSILIAYHDQYLSANTNFIGQVNSLTWEELKTAHYTQTMYLDYSITSLEDLFSNMDNIQKYTFTFDCKLYADKPNMNEFYLTYINAVIKIVQKYQLQNKVCIESQDEDFLSLFKNKEPEYKLFIYPSSFETGIETALALNLYGITISTRDISEKQVKIAHDNNLRIAVWNTHSESDHIEAINKNPDYIQTDKVENLIKLLK